MGQRAEKAPLSLLLLLLAGESWAGRKSGCGKGECLCALGREGEILVGVREMLLQAREWRSGAPNKLISLLPLSRYRYSDETCAVPPSKKKKGGGK